MRRFLPLCLLSLALAAATALLAREGQWPWAAAAACLTLAAVRLLRRLHGETARKVAFLLDAVENDDPAVRFDDRPGAGTDGRRQVNAALNRVARILRDAKRQAARREKYYELVLDLADTGILVLDARGAVAQKNRAALALTGLEVLTHVRQVERVSPELAAALAACVPGDKRNLRVEGRGATRQLALRVSAFRAGDEDLRIVALSDIGRELDEREIDSWARLTRVLTHEIMNALTPVASLSETLLALPEAGQGEMREGLEAIRSTGQGLIRFVTSYRRLTLLPAPEPSLFYVRPFLERMTRLAAHQHPCPNVVFDLAEAADDLLVHADENLVAQAVTNLLKNAVQAIGTSPGGRVTLRARCDEQDCVRVEVSDNGPGIPPDIAEQVFIPFFTTKPDGSGIGLSLSRQIMRLHGGTLTLLPYADDRPETTFVLTFG